MKLKANQKFTIFEAPEYNMVLGAGFIVYVDKDIIVLGELAFVGQFHTIPRSAKFHMISV